MSEKIYCYEELLKKLESSRMYHINTLLNLENVVIKTKKDGTPFKNVNQNFEGAYIDTSFGAYCPRFECKGFTFNCYLYEEELPKDDERRSQLQYNGYRKVYLLTVQEIVERLEVEKQKQRDYIANYDEQIIASKEIFLKVEKKFEELKDLIKNETFSLRIDEKKIYGSTLEYGLQDFVKTNIR